MTMFLFGAICGVVVTAAIFLYELRRARRQPWWRSGRRSNVVADWAHREYERQGGNDR